MGCWMRLRSGSAQRSFPTQAVAGWAYKEKSASVRFVKKRTRLKCRAAALLPLCSATSVHWLVLRGISDFGDRKKDDTWQAVAIQQCEELVHRV